MKLRSASFSTEQDDRQAAQIRPKSVFSILSDPIVTSEAPKRRSAYAAVKVEADIAKEKLDSEAKHTSAESAGNMSLYSRPLPVYSRMNSATKSPTTSEVKPLASVIADSVKTGEATKTMRKLPEPGSSSKAMFFRAARGNSRTEVVTNPDKIENVVKLDNTKFSVTKSDATPAVAADSLPVRPAEQKRVKPPPLAEKPKPGATSINRKDSLKDQYNKLQVSRTKQVPSFTFFVFFV